MSFLEINNAWHSLFYTTENSVTNIHGLTQSEKPLFSDFKAIFDIHSHPYNPFASQKDMDGIKFFPNVEYSIYFKDEQSLFKYTDKENNTKSIKINSMDDLMKYIFQQFK